MAPRGRELPARCWEWAVRMFRHADGLCIGEKTRVFLSLRTGIRTRRQAFLTTKQSPHTLQELFCRIIRENHDFHPRRLCRRKTLAGFVAAACKGKVQALATPPAAKPLFCGQRHCRANIGCMFNAALSNVCPCRPEKSRLSRQAFS